MQLNRIGHFFSLNKQFIVGPIVKRYSSCFFLQPGMAIIIIMDVSRLQKKVYSLLRNIHFYDLFRVAIYLLELFFVQLFVYFSLSSPSRDDSSWIDESSPAAAPAASEPVRPLFSPKREEGIPPMPRLQSYKIKKKMKDK